MALHYDSNAPGLALSFTGTHGDTNSKLDSHNVKREKFSGMTLLVCMAPLIPSIMSFICHCCYPGSMFGSMALASTSVAMLILSVQGLMVGQAHADDQAHPVTKTAPSTTPSSGGGIIAITLPGGSKLEVLPPISGSNWEVKVEKVRDPAGPPEVSERALPRPASRSPWNLLLKPRYWDLNHLCYLFLIPQAFLPKNT